MKDNIEKEQLDWVNACLGDVEELDGGYVKRWNYHKDDLTFIVEYVTLPESKKIYTTFSVHNKGTGRLVADNYKDMVQLYKEEGYEKALRQYKDDTSFRLQGSNRENFEDGFRAGWMRCNGIDII
jgi:hypothetical protein